MPSRIHQHHSHAAKPRIFYIVYTSRMLSQHSRYTRACQSSRATNYRGEKKRNHNTVCKCEQLPNQFRDATTRTQTGATPHRDPHARRELSKRENGNARSRKKDSPNNGNEQHISYSGGRTNAPRVRAT